MFPLLPTASLLSTLRCACSSGWRYTVTSVLSFFQPPKSFASRSGTSRIAAKNAAAAGHPLIDAAQGCHSCFGGLRVILIAPNRRRSKESSVGSGRILLAVGISNLDAGFPRQFRSKNAGRARLPNVPEFTRSDLQSEQVTVLEEEVIRGSPERLPGEPLRRIGIAVPLTPVTQKQYRSRRRRVGE